MRVMSRALIHRGSDLVGQPLAAVLSDVLDEALNLLPERLLGSVCAGQACGGLAEHLDFAPVDRLHQRLARGEVPVQRAGSHSSPTRDIVQRDVDSFEGKTPRSHGEQLLAVAQGVRAAHDPTT